jgi:hypothetical protein
MGDEERYVQGLVRKPEGRRPLERPRHRWEDNGSLRSGIGSAAWAGSMRLRIGTGGGLL